MIDYKKIQEIVRQASKLFTDRQSAGRIKEKGMYDFVTAVDEAVQNFIQKELQILYPEISFLGEESADNTIDIQEFCNFFHFLSAQTIYNTRFA